MRGGGYRAEGRTGGKGGQGGSFRDGDEYAEFDGLEEMEDLDNENDGDSSDEAVHDELVLPVALPVSGGPLPPSDEPPKDADEYLRRVQWERMHLSETVDADVVEKPSRRRKQNNKCSLLTQFDAPEVPQERRHCTAWAEDVLAAFRDLRERCAEAREACADEEVHGNTLTARTWRENEYQHRPSTTTLASLDLVSLHDLLHAVTDSIVEGPRQIFDSRGTPTVEVEVQDNFCSSAGNKDAETQSADTSDAVTGPFGSGRFLAEWAFSVLAFVEEPLVDDIQFNLQRLRRACQKAIVSAHTLAESGARKFDSAAHSQATLVLVIVTEHFGQR